MSRVYSQLNNFNQCSDGDNNDDDDEDEKMMMMMMMMKRMKAKVMIMVHWDCNAYRLSFYLRHILLA